ncbi:MAG TPA: LLM class flavin-dependent oxidoreductase [Acidimicrobiales bacterium]|nr:LLM class flavin-dependent oxidoreductase [Acidimicrobiales bacterium]
MFHLFLPQMRMSPADIVERARAAEAAGFEGMAFMDHLAPPLALEHDMWEAMTIAGWVLAHTTDLVVGHLVLCDALRHPAVLARQVTTLDHASGGRFELGIGWGSVPEELETFGVGSTEARARVGRLAESLEILHGLWSGEVVDHRGEHFTLVGAQQRPVPTRHIPITIGGTGKRTTALVHRYADWWNVPIHQLGVVDGLRERAGDVRLSTQATVCLLGDESERAAATATIERRFRATPMRRHMVVGTVPEVVDHFAAQRARGVERVYVWFADFAPVETLQRFAAVVAALG